MVALLCAPLLERINARMLHQQREPRNHDSDGNESSKKMLHKLTRNTTLLLALRRVVEDFIGSRAGLGWHSRSARGSVGRQRTRRSHVDLPMNLRVKT